MPTNAIGTGTKQLLANVPTDFHEAIAMLARASGAKSAGDFIRKTLVAGVATTDKAAAESLKKILRSYYGTMHVLLALLSLSAMFGGVQMRRPSRTARAATVRVQRVRKEVA